MNVLREHREEEHTSPNRNAYKVRAFDNAIKYLNNLDHPLESAGEALTLKGIGPGIARRINEFLTQRQNKADASDEESKARSASIRKMLKYELQNIPHIGAVKAQQLVDAGLEKIADLREPKFLAMLNNAQRLSLQYMQHLEKPVSREEAETVADFTRACISSKYEVILAGSYRRGAATSSDIDIIILHPNHVHVPVPNISPPKPSLKPPPRIGTSVLLFKFIKGEDKMSPLHTDIVPTLENRGLVAAFLTKGPRKWQGIVRVPERDENGVWVSIRERLQGIAEKTGAFKRLDISLVPMKSRGAAMLSLTGDAHLNRHLRLKAIKMGMHLNEFGLWKWVPNTPPHAEEQKAKADSVAVEEPEADAEIAEETEEGKRPSGFWQLTQARTEEEIFEELGFDFIEPNRRNFAFLSKGAVLAQKK